jgi:hypothetical protein
MNVDSELRHAAEEMERVTASLAPPPIGEVRRSARLHIFAVAIVAAVVVAVVGGAVLALRPSGDTTLGPAAPGETTVPPNTTEPAELTFYGIPMVVLTQDAAPGFEMPGALIAWMDDPPEKFAADLELVRGSSIWEEFAQVERIGYIGSSGQGRAYVLSGESAEPPVGSDRTHYFCVVTVADGIGGLCDSTPDTGGLHMVDPGPSSYSLAGRMPERTSVVSMEIDGNLRWVRTREGYVYISAEGRADSTVRYTAYDADGRILGMYDTGGTEIPTDGTCSGGLYYPSSYPREDLPESVVQTLGKITLFGSRCWFDDLELVAGDGFTASFGGGDPSDLWTRQEENGEQPMYQLMRILDMPHGIVDLGDQLMYVWPSAAAFDGPWDEMPDADKEPLRALYDEEDFADFAAFGGYIGYRIGITADGDWSFFVAGD